MDKARKQLMKDSFEMCSQLTKEVNRYFQENTPCTDEQALWNS